MGFSVPSSACGLYLEIALREWDPNSTQRVCGSSSSPPTLLSAVSRSTCNHTSPCRNPKTLVSRRLYSICCRRVSVCPSICQSHAAVLYRNGWTYRAGFWHGRSFVPPTYYIPPDVGITSDVGINGKIEG